MCGIDGFFSASSVVDGATFYAAHRLLAHRGPDDEGFVALLGEDVVRFRGENTSREHADVPDMRDCGSARVAIGHRRLSIIDLTSGGHQPMATRDDRYWLAYNGEIYNYVELRAELEALGYTFASASDTEVVLHALVAWGPEAVRRFNGMWALALWDVERGTLLLSRDRFGIKPLFYSVRDGALLFASEMKFIRACACRSFDPNPRAVAAYVETARLFDGDETLWAGISELPPGHYLEYDGVSAPAITRYWELHPTADITDIEAAMSRFGEILDDSLRLRLRSDVRVGSLLSGGLDSSLIVARLHELGLLGSGTFASFSAVSRDERYSERRYVEAMAERLPLEKHLVELDPTLQAGRLDDVMRHIETPFRSMSVIAQYSLYERIATETDVKVLLNGQGGDELFGGYTHHYLMLFGLLLRCGRYGRLLREANAFMRGRGFGWRRVAADAWTYARRVRGSWAWFNIATSTELTHSALREYLAYDDRTSMAFGVEARVPFLDYRMVEFAFSLHPDLKILDFENKRLPREWSRGRLPEEIRSRRDKMGFTTPQEQWQRKELAASMAAAGDAMRTGMFGGLLEDPVGEIERYEGYLSGHNNDWARAWRMFCLHRWMIAHDVA